MGALLIEYSLDHALPFQWRSSPSAPLVPPTQTSFLLLPQTAQKVSSGVPAYAGVQEDSVPRKIVPASPTSHTSPSGVVHTPRSVWTVGRGFSQCHELTAP